MGIAANGLKGRLPRVALWLALVLALALPQPAVRAEALLHGFGLLWKIEGGGAAPSYLFGTVNGGAKRDHLGGVRRDRLAAAGLSP